jgi:hypothetical protein
MTRDDYEELQALVREHVATLKGQPMTARAVLARAIVYLAALVKTYGYTAEEVAAVVALAASSDVVGYQVPETSGRPC